MFQFPLSKATHARFMVHSGHVDTLRDAHELFEREAQDWRLTATEHGVTKVYVVAEALALPARLQLLPAEPIASPSTSCSQASGARTSRRGGGVHVPSPSGGPRSAVASPRSPATPGGASVASDSSRGMRSVADPRSQSPLPPMHRLLEPLPSILRGSQRLGAGPPRGRTQTVATPVADVGFDVPASPTPPVADVDFDDSIDAVLDEAFADVLPGDGSSSPPRVPLRDVRHHEPPVDMPIARPKRVRLNSKSVDAPRVSSAEAAGNSVEAATSAVAERSFFQIRGDLAVELRAALNIVVDLGVVLDRELQELRDSFGNIVDGELVSRGVEREHATACDYVQMCRNTFATLSQTQETI